MIRSSNPSDKQVKCFRIRFRIQTVESEFIFELLIEIEIGSKLENILTCFSEAQMCPNHVKNRGRKFHNTLPVRNLLCKNKLAKQFSRTTLYGPRSENHAQ